ncbi:hypothetical protein K502DRAFT_354063 [Neoconidiobolus thromboides FSU 785]|nr:hypothetical protein K502DRAFT_354063 [Neoconidiobolus thromboides FSU 785]
MWFGSEADEGGDNNPQQLQSQSQPEQTPQGQPQGQSQPEQIPPQQLQGKFKVKKMKAPLAQLAERGANNAKVIGSSPIRSISFSLKKDLTLFSHLFVSNLSF